MSWATWDFPEPPYMNEKFGITAGKKILNNLHYKLGVTGFSEVGSCFYGLVDKSHNVLKCPEF